MLSGGLHWSPAVPTASGGRSSSASSPAGATVAAVDVEPVPDLGPAVVGFEFDLSATERLEELVDEVEAKVGPLDVLVNNAGHLRARARGRADARVVSPRARGEPRRARSSSPRAPAAAWPTRGYGRIVNITSIHGRFGEELALSYDTAKGGLEQATRTLAIELSRARRPRQRRRAGLRRHPDVASVDGVNELEGDWFKRHLRPERQAAAPPLRRAGRDRSPRRLARERPEHLRHRPGADRRRRRHGDVLMATGASARSRPPARAGAEALLAARPSTVTWLTGFAEEIEWGPSPFALSPLALLDAGRPADPRRQRRRRRGGCGDRLRGELVPRLLGRADRRRRRRAAERWPPRSAAAASPPRPARCPPRSRRTIDWVDVGDGLAARAGGQGPRRDRADPRRDRALRRRAGARRAPAPSPGMTELELWALVRARDRARGRCANADRRRPRRRAADGRDRRRARESRDRRRASSCSSTSCRGGPATGATAARRSRWASRRPTAVEHHRAARERLDAGARRGAARRASRATSTRSRATGSTIRTTRATVSAPTGTRSRGSCPGSADGARAGDGRRVRARLATATEKECASSRSCS